MTHYEDLDGEKINEFEKKRESIIYSIKEGYIECEHLAEEGERLDKKQLEISTKL
jgi:hypothetical protein